MWIWGDPIGNFWKEDKDKRKKVHIKGNIWMWSFTHFHLLVFPLHWKRKAHCFKISPNSLVPNTLVGPWHCHLWRLHFTAYQKNFFCGKIFWRKFNHFAFEIICSNCFYVPIIIVFPAFIRYIWELFGKKLNVQIIFNGIFGKAKFSN